LHGGSFRRPTLRNTDGVALTRTGFVPFPAGTFYAVHDDGNVAAFSWSAIADALNLSEHYVQQAL
jgi:3-phytase